MEIKGDGLQLLPCQHYLCGKCIVDMPRKGNGKISCPYCIHECSIPDNGQFPRFRYGIQLYEFIKKVKNVRKEDSAQPLPRPNCEEVESQNASREQRKAVINAKPQEIRKFSFILPRLTHLFWGLQGKLYATNYIDNPLKPQGLYCVDTIEGEVTHFGDLESVYTKGIVMEEELYVYNDSRRAVEVYQDEKFQREWQLCVFRNELVRMVRHPLGGLLMLFRLYHGKDFILALLHTDQNGDIISFSRNDRKHNKSEEMVCKSKVLSVYGGSIWLIHQGILYEIPVEQQHHEIVYRKAKYHFKFNNKTFGASGIGEEGILFREDNSKSTLRMVNLVALVDSTSTRQKKSSQNKDRMKQNRSVLLTDVGDAEACIVGSEDGYLAVLSNNAVLTVYAMNEDIIKGTMSKPGVQDLKKRKDKPKDSFEKAPSCVHRCVSIATNCSWFFLIFHCVLTYFIYIFAFDDTKDFVRMLQYATIRATIWAWKNTGDSMLYHLFDKINICEQLLVETETCILADHAVD
ncbi:hypothetical protein EB796_023873 [Bugula neritina]|uniref:Zinc finger C3HC4 RING-type domain-containing protein n=1 Tax=Bugula neritina TaxID=10212 RepID=A0A7J7IV97_BUGNE|nr:hypothetical protein EB796_023873 [Bugula neritina]